jgi:hypothetical protein
MFFFWGGGRRDVYHAIRRYYARFRFSSTSIFEVIIDFLNGTLQKLNIIVQVLIFGPEFPVFRP